MAGTVAGGKKAAAAIKAYNPDHYRRIGAIGGQARSEYKGFGSNRALARTAGAAGGRRSRRHKEKEEA